MRKASNILLAAGIVCGACAVWAAKPSPRPERVEIAPRVPSTPRKGDSRVFLDRADKMLRSYGNDYTVVTGNVQFTRDGMVMKCDSAHFFTETESFDAFGHISMEQGDTLFIYADELNFDAPGKIAYLYADPGKKVKLINRGVTLETDIFTYDLDIEIGYYTTGGYLHDGQNRLTSTYGEYVPSTKESNFYDKVALQSLGKDDTLYIFSDSLYYNTNTRVAIVTSPSEIINGRGTIYTRDAYYDTTRDSTIMFDRSLVVSPEGRTVTADTIVYDRLVGIAECWGGAVLTDSVRQASLTADYVFFNQGTDSAYATGRLLVKEYSKGDTLYLHGKQINAFRITDSVHVAGTPADTILGTPAVPDTIRVDTFNVADIWPRVRFFRSDMQGLCDSMHVSNADTTLRMYRHPVIWSEQRQIFGNIIELHMNDSTIDEANLPDFAFTCEHLSDEYYNQISGKKMNAKLEDGSLRQLYIDGNVELIMYPEENDSTINKMVNATSAYLLALFKDGTTEYIKMWPQTSGQATPLFLLRKSQLYLPKFQLFKGMRPLSPDDVMVVPPAMEAIMKEN